MTDTTVSRHLRVDVMETRTTIENLVQSLDLPLDGVRDAKQLETLEVLLAAAYDLLKHAEAIAEHPGASLSRQELALVQVMIGELRGDRVDVDDLRMAIHELMRVPQEEA